MSGEDQGDFVFPSAVQLWQGLRWKIKISLFLIDWQFVKSTNMGSQLEPSQILLVIKTGIYNQVLDRGGKGAGLSVHSSTDCKTWRQSSKCFFLCQSYIVFPQCFFPLKPNTMPRCLWNILHGFVCTEIMVMLDWDEENRVLVLLLLKKREGGTWHSLK